MLIGPLLERHNNRAIDALDFWRHDKRAIRPNLELQWRGPGIETPTDADCAETICNPGARISTASATARNHRFKNVPPLYAASRGLLHLGTMADQSTHGAA